MRYTLNNVFVMREKIKRLPRKLSAFCFCFLNINHIIILGTLIIWNFYEIIYCATKDHNILYTMFI